MIKNVSLEPFENIGNHCHRTRVEKSVSKMRLKSPDVGRSLGILGPDGVPGYGYLGILGPDGVPGYGTLGILGHEDLVQNISDYFGALLGASGALFGATRR